MPRGRPFAGPDELLGVYLFLAVGFSVLAMDNAAPLLWPAAGACWGVAALG